MSGRRMSKGFSSTPVKSGQGKDLNTAKGLEDDCVLSDDEDTFSLLSPIYHDSFDSDCDEAPEPCTARRTSPRPSVSPDRCELPRTPSDLMLNVEALSSPTLNAWEVWLVNKAKEDRLKWEKKEEEERLLKEKEQQQQKEQEQKRVIVDKKIQDWLRTKQEQEMHKQFEKHNKEEQEMQRHLEKQRDIDRRAKQKYKDWLQKKNQEKIERDKKEKEEAALKEEQEKERRRKAEEKFKEWLVKANEKSRASPKPPCSPTGPYIKSYPSPSFYNPIPWKPIHVPPPPEPSPSTKTSTKKPQKQQNRQQSPGTGLRLRNSAGAAHMLQRR